MLYPVYLSLIHLGLGDSSVHLGHQVSIAAFSERMSPTTVILQLFILLAVVACSTRFISGRRYTSDMSPNRSNGDARKVATLPYWFPYFGHLLPLTINPDSFLQKCWCV